MYAMLQAKETAELAIVLHALTFVEDLSFFSSLHTTVY